MRQHHDFVPSAEFEDQRVRMRQALRMANVSARVTEAIMRVPRERFVPPAMRRHAWVDTSMPIGQGQTISQPSLVGRMIDQLEIKEDHRVLDVGTGSGYQAAILSLLAREVISVERVEPLRQAAAERLSALGYSNVEVIAAGNELGCPELSPFDGIIVGAASPAVPDSLVQQLAIEGRLVIPVGGLDDQQIVVVQRTEHGTRERRTDHVRFVPLIGEEAWTD